MSEVKNWSSTADDNNNAVPNGAPLNWTGANLGPWARATMAAVHKYYSDPAWVAPLVDEATSAANPANTATFTVSSSSNLSSYFNTGRLLRITTAGGTKLGFVSGHSYGSGVNTVTVSQTLDNGALALDGIEFFNGQTGTAPHGLGAMSFGGAGTTAERDAKFGTASSSHPDGLVWFNTSLNQIEVIGDDVWVSAGPVAMNGSASGPGWKDANDTNGPKTLELKGSAAATTKVAFSHGSKEPSIYFDSAADHFAVEGQIQSGASNRLVFDGDNGKAYFNPRLTGTSWPGDQYMVDAFGLPGHTPGRNVRWHYKEEVENWTVGGTEFLEVGDHDIVNDSGNAVAPRLITVTAVCTTAPASNGNGSLYSVNDEIPLSFYNDNGAGITVVATTTKLKYKIRARIRVCGSGNNNYDLETDKWKLVFRAWR